MVVVAGYLTLKGRGPGGGAGEGWGPAPDFALTDMEGEPVTLADFRGRTVVLFFGFTHCPDVCPFTMASLARALERDDLPAAEIQVLFVTVDPLRDTPERLTEYLANFHPSFRGLTGSEAELRDAAFAYGGFFQYRTREGEIIEPTSTHSEHGGHTAEGEGYLVDHSGRAYVIDGQGRLITTLQPWMDGEGVAEVLLEVAGR